MANRNIYLVAKYTGRPKDPRQTAKAGYMTNPDNIEYEEQVYITRGLRDKDTQNHVVLNLTEEKIVKNTFNTGVSFEEILAHYVEGYADYINDSVNALNEAIQVK
jgi:hypothetical protein